MAEQQEETSRPPAQLSDVAAPTLQQQLDELTRQVAAVANAQTVLADRPQAALSDDDRVTLEHAKFIMQKYFANEKPASMTAKPVAKAKVEFEPYIVDGVQQRDPLTGHPIFREKPPMKDY